MESRYQILKLSAYDSLFSYSNSILCCFFSWLVSWPLAWSKGRTRLVEPDDDDEDVDDDEWPEFPLETEDVPIAG